MSFCIKNIGRKCSESDYELLIANDKEYKTLRDAKSAKTRLINKIIKNTFAKNGENYIMCLYRKKILNEEWVILEK